MSNDDIPFWPGDNELRIAIVPKIWQINSGNRIAMAFGERECVRRTNRAEMWLKNVLFAQQKTTRKYKVRQCVLLLLLRLECCGKGP